MYFHCIVEMIDCRRYRRSSNVTHALYGCLAVRLDVTTPFAIPGFSRSFISQRIHEDFFVFIVRVPSFSARRQYPDYVVRPPNGKPIGLGEISNIRGGPFDFINSIVSGRSRIWGSPNRVPTVTAKPVYSSFIRAIYVEHVFYVSFLRKRRRHVSWCGHCRLTEIVKCTRVRLDNVIAMSVFSGHSSAPYDGKKTEIGPHSHATWA